MTNANILQYKTLYTKIVEARVLFGQDCEVLILHSLFEEMKVTNLEVEYLKGWKGLEGIGYL